jgi:rhamnosyltransferase
MAAVYTTYYPDKNFRSRIAGVVAICEAVIVVDNTPGGHDFSEDEAKDLIILQDGRNKGLGAAINLGLVEVRQQGLEAVVLFDQDSSPSPEFIQRLSEALTTAGSKAIVGPVLVDDATTGQQMSCAIGVELKAVTALPTSGMCFNLSELPNDAQFTEDYFLDFVDFDWCWKLRAKGWKIYKIKSLQMLHRLGLAQNSFLGRTYHVPSPFRHYFQFRDTLKLIIRKNVPTYSRLRLLAILPIKFLVYPFLLDRGVERFRWMLLGIRDGVLGVPGAGAAASKLQGS